MLCQLCLYDKKSGPLHAYHGLMEFRIIERPVANEPAVADGDDAVMALIGCRVRPCHVPYVQTRSRSTMEGEYFHGAGAGAYRLYNGTNAFSKIAAAVAALEPQARLQTVVRANMLAHTVGIVDEEHPDDRLITGLLDTCASQSIVFGRRRVASLPPRNVRRRAPRVEDEEHADEDDFASLPLVTEPLLSQSLQC